MCTWQEAIEDADQAGLRGIASSAESPDDDFATEAGGAAAQLDARRVSRFWLRKYLSSRQQAAAARLSLFAATFAADGAAAVLHGPAAPRQQADSAKMLRGLRGVSVVQEVQQPAAVGQCRYSMHPLVHGVAVELRGDMSVSDREAAENNFVAYMLQECGGELAGLQRTAVDAPVAARLLAVEAPNFAAMLRLVAKAAQSRDVAMLEEDSQRGAARRGAMNRLALSLWLWGNLTLAAEAGRARVACQKAVARSPRHNGQHGQSQPLAW